MRVSFTGHRPDKIKSPAKVKQQLKKALLSQLGDLNAHTYVVGGCPGFDTLALEVLLESKVDKKNILLAVPFRGFEKYAGFKHPKENQAAYEFNYTCGVEIKEVGGRDGSFGQKCFNRNIYLVDNCDIIFTNWDSSNGGTANTVKLAIKKNIPVVNIMEKS
jgi:uncharacterized phage-like protein YoqJ